MGSMCYWGWGGTSTALVLQPGLVLHVQCKANPPLCSGGPELTKNPSAEMTKRGTLSLKSL